MAEQTETRWIVLLNKAPKGPLTLEEVKALIDQGYLRLNDVAFAVSADDNKKLSDWKLLWQFPEFNRRSQRLSDVPPPEELAPITAAPTEDRRRQMSEDEAKQKVASELPDDLSDINPGDLVSRSVASRTTRAEDFRPEPEERPSSEKTSWLPSFGGEGSSGSSTWLFGSVALGLLALAFVYFTRTPDTAVPPAPKSVAKAPPSAAPASAKASARAPAARPPGSAPAAAPPMPVDPVVTSGTAPAAPSRRDPAVGESRFDRPPPDTGDIPRDDEGVADRRDDDEVPVTTKRRARTRRVPVNEDGESEIGTYEDTTANDRDDRETD